MDLLGRTIEDNIKINHLKSKKDIHFAILGLDARARSCSCPAEQAKMLKYNWAKHMQPLLQKH